MYHSIWCTVGLLTVPNILHFLTNIAQIELIITEEVGIIVPELCA